jgi:hypothetical protein
MLDLMFIFWLQNKFKCFILRFEKNIDAQAIHI